MKKIFSFFSFLAISLSSQGYASSYIVENALPIIYLQAGSSNHMVRIKNVKVYGNGEHPWCGRALYFSSLDTEVASALMTASFMNRKVNIYYKDEAPKVTIAGHRSTQCKIFSVWF